MRRILITVALLAACAKGETPADTSAAAAPATPAPVTLADIAGEWDNKVMAMDRDTVLTTSVGTISATGAVSSKLPDGQTVPGQIVLEGDSIVTTAGPFKSQLRKGQTVSTRQVTRLRDGKIVGTLYAKYSNGDSTAFRVEGVRKTKTP